MLGTLLENSRIDLEYDAPDADAFSEAVDLAALHSGTSIENVGVSWNADLLHPAEGNPEPINLSCALVLIDEWSSSLPTLPIHFTSRSLTQDELTIQGSDPSGALTVSLFVSLPSRAARLNLSFEPEVRSLPPITLAGLLEVFEPTESPRQLGLWLLDEGLWLLEPQNIRDDLPKLPASLLFQIRALARIQQLTGMIFPIPDQLDIDDVRNIARANALLSRNKVRGNWREVTVKADKEALDVVVQNTGNSGAQIEFVAETAVTIGGHIIPLGLAKYTLIQALMAPNKSPDSLPDAQFAVTLAPGENSKFEVELLEPGGDKSSHFPNGPAKELLRTYAGRWIAQDGRAVILDGDSPDTVIAQLRKRGQLATVWRVPRSQMEAEAVDLFTA